MACLARCARCSRCNFVTISRGLFDCSWYATCDRIEPAAGFRSAAIRLFNSHDETEGGSQPQVPHNLKANLEACERAPSPSFAVWRDAVRDHLTEHDHAMFQRATGGTIAALIHEMHADSEVADFSRLMGNDKFYPHRLNAKGVMTA